MFMPESVRSALIVISLAFVVVGMYHRILSMRTGEKLDRTKEGWPILIGLRLTGVALLALTATWLWNPRLMAGLAFPVPERVRWIGVGGFAFGIVLLMWMFVSLGRNLTDTVVTRRDAHLVESGPYRYVRNPMYVGVLIAGLSLGFALGTLVVPVGAMVMFLIFARRTRIEEMYLIARFGDEYREYMKRVGRFFPRF